MFLLLSLQKSNVSLSERSLVRRSPMWAALVMCVGCGSDSASIVEGTVTCGSELVESGLVRFVPIEGTTGPVNVGTIQQGKYRLDAHGGVRAGSYRIEIDAWKTSGRKGAAPARDGRPPETDERVRLGPAVYAGSQSPLKMDVPHNLRQPIDIQVPER